ncbi:MAG: Fe-S cluster assembly protein SufD [Alphaproteobacteria bacterium]|nr:Fe-S cluster assembly protein SufD [Alphaproteobacteria bacterium]
MSLASVIERSHREKESWRYTNVAALLADLKATTPVNAPSRREEISPHAPRFVFVNGIWQAEQSQLGDLPPGIMQGDAKQGYRLTLAGQTCLVTSPVELLFITDKPQAETGTKLHIELGQSGRLTLIERHEAPAGETVHVMETEITLQPQAKLVHGKIIKGGAAAHLAMTKVHVAEGAFYDNFALIKGGRLTRNEIEAVLAGKLAQCTLNGAMLLRGREHADTTTRITHAAPHGTSREVYKTVLAGQARGVFQGKIIVAEGAQKTDGHQLSRALLLSDQAEMDAKPELEIYADDVKCSHGSTVGDLDPSALFYLRARGLNEHEARGLLIHAFVDEILDEIHVPEWRDLCRAEVEGWLDEQS